MLARLGLGRGDIYDPKNQDHQNKINRQVADVKEKFASLAKVDGMIGAALSMETYLIMSGWAGSWGPWISLPVYIATAKGIAGSMGRSGKAEEFIAARNQLYQTYLWCLNSLGVSGTQDEGVLRALGTLQPFVQNRDALKPDGMKACREDDMSLEFKRLLAACPQDGERIWPHAGDQTVTETLGGVFKDIRLIQAAGWIENSINNNWTRFFSKAAANAVRLGYGSKFEQEEKTAPQLN